MAVLSVSQVQGLPLTVAGACSSTPGKVRRVEVNVTGSHDLVLIAGEDAIAFEFGTIADEGDATAAAAPLPGGAAAALGGGISVLCVSSETAGADFWIQVRR